MEDSTSLKDFQEWIKQTNKAIDGKTIQLASLAMKKNKKYSAAMNWLDKNKPDAPTSYNATPVETFVNGVVAGMFKEAKRMIHDKAVDQEIKHNGH
ncbi:hypothetical protein EFP68_01435 [Lactobacillus helveticus]|uniref:hypothetical protein n=1 Tax=Lactobacillus helveticus TaxID=1587 RepID=UPI001C1E836C|nr:hypothetical protein [Lactobacillus helveticus]MBU5980064.1 hypothetical protein [Lactobacillus helveticus]MCT3413408.1 hypothetical protein [Lactobacillus helveticus]